MLFFLTVKTQVVSPFRPNTTAGRLLSKRGDGGYMIIMQTRDAVARRSYIEANKLGKVIFSYEVGDAVCIQYHPKGIKGRSPATAPSGISIKHYF